jgi:hypothetical protein
MLFMALLAWREGAPTFLRVRPRYTSLLCKFCARWRVCIIMACDREQHQPNVHRDMPDGEILPLLCGCSYPLILLRRYCLLRIVGRVEDELSFCA